MQSKDIKFDKEKFMLTFTNEAKKELVDLLKSVNEDYKPKVKELAFELVENYRLLTNLNDSEKNDQKRKEYKENIKHLKSAMSSLEATVQIKLYDKVLTICEKVASVALKVAISAAIAL